MFGNWGALPSQNPALRRRVVEQLQHCPAQILFLAECDMEMETVLKKRGCAPGAASTGAAQGSAAAAAAGAASGEVILDSENVEMTQGTYVCYSLKVR